MSCQCMKWLVLSALLAVVPAIMTGPPATSTAAEAVSVNCEGWNTDSFFERAGAGDVTRCLKAGADVNARDGRVATPLHYATAISKTPEVVVALLDAGADVNARDNYNSTPLHYLGVGAAEIATVLLKAGVRTSTRDKTTIQHRSTFCRKAAVLRISRRLC